MLINLSFWCSYSWIFFLFLWQFLGTFLGEIKTISQPPDKDPSYATARGGDLNKKFNSSLKDSGTVKGMGS